MLNYEVVAGNPSHISHYCLVLHGLGDSRHGWRPVAQELPVPGLAWVFVDAPEPYYDGFSWFPIPGMTDPYASEEDLATGIARSRGLLQELIDHLLQKWDLPAKRLLLLGFSQGCTMVLDQALRSDHRFAGVIGISGWLALDEEYPEALGTAAREQQLLITHGHHDEVVPAIAAEHSAERLQQLGITAHLSLYDKAHSLDPAQEMPNLRAFLKQIVQG
jgi:phospholipase/carboxylesterase